MQIKHRNRAFEMQILSNILQSSIEQEERTSFDAIGGSEGNLKFSRQQFRIHLSTMFH